MSEPGSSLAPWLVTGASGFLGRHLLETIARSTPRRPLVALVQDLAAWQAMEWTRALTSVQPLVGSILEGETWQNAPVLDGLGGIFHLAALVRHSRRDSAFVMRTNVAGTLAMVRLAARRRCRLVHLSSSGTVGCFRKPGALPDESAGYCETEIGRWPYYRSKLEAERQARQLAGELGVELVIVRPPILLGPGDHRQRSSAHVRRLLQGQVPFLIRGGMHFADVRDVAAALVTIMELAEPRPIYHLPGTICSVAEFYRDVAELAGKRPPRFLLPFRPAWLLAKVTHGLGLGWLPEPILIEMAAHHWGIGSRYAASELGYVSRPGKETLWDTIRWLREGR